MYEHISFTIPGPWPLSFDSSLTAGLGNTSPWLEGAGAVASVSRRSRSRRFKLGRGFVKG
jgi:hypothetical protein